MVVNSEATRLPLLPAAQTAAAPGRLVVVWRVTERCNLACAFCAYDRTVARTRTSANPDHILKFGRALAGYARQTGGEVLISWLGGEPLLWTPLEGLEVELCRDLGLRLAVTTNGTTLGSRRIRDRLLNHYQEVTVSVDGLGDLHDHLRGWPGGFQQLRRWITEVATEKRGRGGSGPLLRANVVLMRDNVDDLAALCFELARWGIEEVTMNQLGGLDRPEFFPAHSLEPAQVQRLGDVLPTLRPALKQVGVRLSGSHQYLTRIAATARRQSLPVADCAPGQRFLFISEAGLAAPCSFSTTDYGVPIQQLTTAQALSELPQHFERMQAGRRLSACADCHSTQVFGKFRGAS